jgi:putative ABC transport system ATP-binding protein
MTPLVEVRQLTKTYAEGAAASRALDGVDLDIYPGEVTLLMGPSGSGKTTLVSIMGCILRATSGSVKIAGREITRLKERELPAVRLRHIGFVFQGFNLFPTLSAAENVEVALDLKGIRGASAHSRSRALLDQVGLDEKHDAFPADLSGGQKQRVAIARALAGDPEIVLADEPTAALDKVSGRTVMEMLRGLARKGRAVVIVTHDNRVMEYADRIVHIEDGRVGQAAVLQGGD